MLVASRSHVNLDGVRGRAFITTLSSRKESESGIPVGAMRAPTHLGAKWLGSEIGNDVQFLTDTR